MRKLATVRQIGSVNPIEGADRIEMVAVDGWQCVSKKGQFEPGDLCMYFEIDSVLPDHPAFNFLDSRDKARLRTRKFKKQISQGLALPITEFVTQDAARDLEVGEDYTERLGVEKYEPPLPSQLSGETKGGFPIRYLDRTDEERVQNAKYHLAKLKNKPFYITLKYHGSSFTFINPHDEDEVYVCSRNMNLRYSDKNAYWQVTKKYDLENVIPKGYAIQAELIGPGINGNIHGCKELEIRVFNVWDTVNRERLRHAYMMHFCLSAGLPVVEVLEMGYFDFTAEQLLKKAEGKLESGKEREGIVIRSVDQSISFKAISNKYLLKGGD